MDGKDGITGQQDQQEVQEVQAVEAILAVGEHLAERPSGRPVRLRLLFRRGRLLRRVGRRSTGPRSSLRTRWRLTQVTSGMV